MILRLDFIKRSGIILAILEEGHSRNYTVKYILKSSSISLGDDVDFFSVFSSGGQFVQQSGTILEILVKGHLKTFP